MSVLDSDHVDAIGRRSKVDDVRKSPKRLGANLAIQDRVKIRIALNHLQRFAQVVQELIAQTRPLLFEPIMG